MSVITKQLIISCINNDNGLDLAATSYAVNKHSLDEGPREEIPGKMALKHYNQLKIYSQIRKSKKRWKAQTYKLCQSMYYRGKAKHISSLLDGIMVDTQQRHMNTATIHYQNAWSVNINDKELTVKQNRIDTNSIFNPITQHEIKEAMNQINKDRSGSLHRRSSRRHYFVDRYFLPTNQFADKILSWKSLQFVGNSALGYCQVHDFCRSFLFNCVENLNWKIDARRTISKEAQRGRKQRIKNPKYYCGPQQ